MAPAADSCHHFWPWNMAGIVICHFSHEKVQLVKYINSIHVFLGEAQAMEVEVDPRAPKCNSCRTNSTYYRVSLSTLPYPIKTPQAHSVVGD